MGVPKHWVSENGSFSLKGDRRAVPYFSRAERVMLIA